MNCPVCSNNLDAQVVGEITLDVCSQGCGGVWFDQFEFKKFDEKHEPHPDKSLKLKLELKSGTSSIAKSHGLHQCPKCESISMMRYFSSVKRQVWIDQCPNCAGVWVDAGELAQIRDEFNTDAERIKAADAVFSEMFDPVLAAANQKSMDELKTLRAMGSVLKFISPSYIFRK